MKKREYTMIMAVIDSLTHRFSSSKWPITRQKQRTATKSVKGMTWAWSLPMFFTVWKNSICCVCRLKSYYSGRSELVNGIYRQWHIHFAAQWEWRLCSLRKLSTDTCAIILTWQHTCFLLHFHAKHSIQIQIKFKISLLLTTKLFKW